MKHQEKVNRQQQLRDNAIKLEEKARKKYATLHAVGAVRLVSGHFGEKAKPQPQQEMAATPLDAGVAAAASMSSAQLVSAAQEAEKLNQPVPVTVIVPEVEHKPFPDINDPQLGDGLVLHTLTTHQDRPHHQYDPLLMPVNVYEDCSASDMSQAETNRTIHGEVASIATLSEDDPDYSEKKRALIELHARNRTAVGNTEGLYIRPTTDLGDSGANFANMRDAIAKMPPGVKLTDEHGGRGIAVEIFEDVAKPSDEIDPDAAPDNSYSLPA